MDETGYEGEKDEDVKEEEEEKKKKDGDEVSCFDSEDER